MKHKDKKLKLAYVIHGIAVGGAELAALSAFPDLGHRFELRVYTLGKSNEALIASLPSDVQKNIKRWNFPSYLFPFYFPWVLLSLLRFRPQHVIASLWRSVLPAVFYRLMVKNTRLFLLVHSTFFHHLADGVLTRWGIKKADVVLADSTSTKTFVQKHAKPAKNIRVVSFLLQPTPPQVTTHDFGDAFRFFSVSRLHPVKRMPLAVRVIAALRHAGLEATLDIYGRPDGDGEAVNKEIARLGLQDSVLLCGEIPPGEKGNMYPKYNCYIQMSAHEGMAMSVVEAMQQGMLCAVTPVGEIPHYAQDGVSAVFLDIREGQVSTDSLEKLVDTLKQPARCHDLASNAHQTFAKQPVFVDSLTQVIRNTISYA